MEVDADNDLISILVADDQAGVRRLLSEVFRRDDYRVTLAANGLEAIAMVQKLQPDVLLLDMKMPGLDGLATLRELRKLNQDICVVLMTAYGELEIVNEAMSLGASGHITKPFDVKHLKEVINRLAEQRRTKQ